MTPEQEYNRLNFWVQGWLSRLNSVIKIRNESFGIRVYKILTKQINYLRSRYEKAVERRKPAADALMEKLKKSPLNTANS